MQGTLQNIYLSKIYATPMNGKFLMTSIPQNILLSENVPFNTMSGVLSRKINKRKI